MAAYVTVPREPGKIPTLDSGQLRHRITIQQNQPTVGTNGEPVDVWSTYATVWARIETLTAREWYTAAQTAQEATLRVMIRYRDDIVPKMRVVWGARTLYVRGVLADHLHKRHTLLMCAEVG